MDDDEVQEILRTVPESMGELRRSMQEIHGRAARDVSGLVQRVAGQMARMDTVELRALVEVFRSTEWHVMLMEEKDSRLYVSIRRKIWSEVSRVECFHVTQASRVDDILANGLTTGDRARIPARGGWWLGGQFYIHVFLAREQVDFWQRRLGNGEAMAAISIRMDGDPRLRLYQDVAGGGTTTDELAWIVQGEIIPSDLIQRVP